MKPAFLVDGLTEQRFIQKICPGAPVKLINLNGNSVSSLAIVKRIASLIRIWKGHYYPIIIIIDREDRDITSDNFCKELYLFIEKENISDQLFIGIADRMIENWMIADPELWPEHQIKDNVDNFSGLSTLKKYMPSYNKAATGPDILKKSRASEICKRSQSFKMLFEKISHIQCHWLQQ
jgi:hypothetical protein